jgi:hypothetical protein
LFDLFRECQVDQSIRFHKDLKKSFSGLKRLAQQFKAQIGGRLGEGKKALPHALYKKLCTWLIADGSKEAIFSWSFLTITWNLICRSKNTVNIHRNHISWVNDSLIIQFAHQKTDMVGSDEAVQRHIYANPIDPSICPILALGSYLSITPSRETTGLLFGGSNQYERFRKNLEQILELHQEEIRNMGIDYKDIGVHSIRKGAATYACNGTTCSPSIAAVCNRAGWTMGKVKDIYLQYEAAQDQYVGRIVSGLNIHSCDFSVSPPYFKADVMDDAKVREDVSATFPFVIETNLTPVMQFCFASMMYGKVFLLATLHENSPLRKKLFLQTTPRSQLSWIEVKGAHETTELMLTGIPPHVIYLVRLEEFRRQYIAMSMEQAEAVRTICTNVIAEIRKDLDDRSIGGGQVSLNRFEEMLGPMRQQVKDFIEAFNQQPRNNVAPQPTMTQQAASTNHTTYTWGGKFRRLPEDYTIDNKLTLLAAWQLWHHGDGTETPLRLVNKFDISDNKIENGRQRPIRDTEVKKWSNLRFVCTELDKAAGITVQSPSMEELVALYSSERLRSTLPSETTATQRKRRADELSWRHACDIMRQAKKARE